MKRSTVVAALLVVIAAGNADAQQAKAQKSSAKASGFMAAAGMTKVYDMSKNFILKTAEQVPEDKYSYRPTPEVRTLGAILGHIADGHQYLCGVIAGSAPKGEQPVNEKLEGKAAITTALKKSFDDCDAVLAKVTDADLTRQVNMFGMDVPLSAAVTMLASHDWEHYGNLVTYMRSNNIVPPSSQQGN